MQTPFSMLLGDIKNNTSGAKALKRPQSAGATRGRPNHACASGKADRGQGQAADKGRTPSKQGPVLSSTQKLGETIRHQTQRSLAGTNTTFTVMNSTHAGGIGGGAGAGRFRAAEMQRSLTQNLSGTDGNQRPKSAFNFRKKTKTMQYEDPYREVMRKGVLDDV